MERNTTRDILEFTRAVTALRRDHPVFRRRRFFEGLHHDRRICDIAWLTREGVEMTPGDWHAGIKSVAVFLNGDAIPESDERGERIVDDSFLLCFNAHAYPVEFLTPDGQYARQWTVEIDTFDPSDGPGRVVTAGTTVSIPIARFWCSGRPTSRSPCWRWIAATPVAPDRSSSVAMTQMPAIPPIDTATDPVDTPDDMGDRWRALMGPLGFGQRLLWVGFVGADRRMHKVLSQVPLGRSPHRALVDNLMLGLSVLLETDFAPGTSVALLLTLPVCIRFRWRTAGGHGPGPGGTAVRCPARADVPSQ